MASALESYFHEAASSDGVLTLAGLQALTVRLLCEERQGTLGGGDGGSDVGEEGFAKAIMEDIVPASPSTVTFEEFERWWCGLTQEVAEQADAADQPRGSEYQVRPFRVLPISLPLLVATGMQLHEKEHTQRAHWHEVKVCLSSHEAVMDPDTQQWSHIEYYFVVLVRQLHAFHYGAC